MNSKQHLIQDSATVRQAMQQLNELTGSLTLFVIGDNNVLVGTLTDGDIRRGLVAVSDLEVPVVDVMNTNFSSLSAKVASQAELGQYRDLGIRILPVVDQDGRIEQLIDLDRQSSIIPADAIVMAGGKGSRLMPKTEKTPKPLLEIGGKAIIEYILSGIERYGHASTTVTVKHLGGEIEKWLNRRNSSKKRVSCIFEDQPLGTIGGARLIDNFEQDYLLLVNSDLLTNINFNDFFNDFRAHDADLAVATSPYEVKVPYAVLELEGQKVVSFSEKPNLTYQSNAGMYYMKRELLELVPSNTFFDATDLLKLALDEGKKVICYPILGYWLDIGNHEDFAKAQRDVEHIQFA